MRFAVVRCRLSVVCLRAGTDRHPDRCREGCRYGRTDTVCERLCISFRRHHQQLRRRVLLGVPSAGRAPYLVHWLQKGQHQGIGASCHGSHVACQQDLARDNCGGIRRHHVPIGAQDAEGSQEVQKGRRQLLLPTKHTIPGNRRAGRSFPERQVVCADARPDLPQRQSRPALGERHPCNSRPERLGQYEPARLPAARPHIGQL